MESAYINIIKLFSCLKVYILGKFKYCFIIVWGIYLIMMYFSTLKNNICILSWHVSNNVKWEFFLLVAKVLKYGTTYTNELKIIISLYVFKHKLKQDCFYYWIMFIGFIEYNNLHLVYIDKNTKYKWIHVSLQVKCTVCNVR